MKSFRDLAALILGILLAACLFTYYSSRPSKPASNKSAASGQALVDTSILQTALGLSPLAATPDEQAQAREAWRLADHELDLTFAAALREAETEAAPPSTGPLRQLQDQISALKGTLDADKKRVDELTKRGDQDLDRAQAQLELDQDALDDAQQDLVREGGDKRARLERLLQEHEASNKVADQALKFASPGPTGTLSEQLRTWLALGAYTGQLRLAAGQASSHARTLLEQHKTLEREVPAQPSAAASLARLRQLSAQRKLLAGLDQRIDDSRQLVAIYQRWSAYAEDRQRAALHLLLRSLAIVLAILLAAVLLHRALYHAFRQADPRRVLQLRMIAGIAIDVVAALLILLVLFGPPTQLSTMIGLVTAGFTVVMKDFIVAFLGWFTLMGKNGVSVGDWVEIEGVSGEVIKIGLLKTVLLELGNWTDAGHPTGRRVAFSNSFAMERHYFNFTTAGQWLWDEIQFTLPAKDDPYQTARKIQEIVERETQADAAEAVKEWQRVNQPYSSREFPATPAVNLRPGTSGFEVVARYITRAPQRGAVRSKLYRAIVDLLRKPA